MVSALQKKRLEYKPSIPQLLKDLKKVGFYPASSKKAPHENLKKLFPHTFSSAPHQLKEAHHPHSKPLKVGFVFSGGQAAGGHNVAAALFDALHSFDPKSELIGFLGGPSGIIDNEWRRIESKELSLYRNQGGFDLVGSGRTKIQTEGQLASALKTVCHHKLDGLVIIGGDDSNTNAAILAEYFLDKGCPTRVIGVPKTIDGDLQTEDIEISFGFDSACKTYAELIGNIARDALSAKKYYHFIKLMGRSASHIALECALATQPNLTLIGEERKGIDQIVSEIADLIANRFKAGKEYGVVLVPEGLIEFIPEVKEIIQELNRILAKDGSTEPQNGLSEKLKKRFESFPEKIRKQLLLDRDPHGNVQVSQIETEVLLMDLVKKELKKRGDYKGKFKAQEHFLGYEGRSCMPTNFDANYCYALGTIAALAIRDNLTGMIASVQHLARPAGEWRCKMAPIVQMMDFEMRSGKEKPVIQKALVDLSGKPFNRFAKMRKSWEIEDHYQYPGPIQFFGDPALTDSAPLILRGVL